MSTEPVTICIPAYNAAPFLAATIESALSQRHPDVRVVIAVEPGTDGTARIAQRYARGNTRVLINSRRLGWIRNSNYVLSQAKTRYAMILPHDDLLEPNYVADCLDELKRNPAAVVCYPDIDVIGKPKELFKQSSITGAVEDRIVSLLAVHFNSVAYRGVIDRHAAQHHLIPLSTGGYAADTLFLATLAAQGELVRLPGVRYHKLMAATTTHARWRANSALEFYEMWAVHCLELVDVLMRTNNRIVWTDRLQEAWEARVYRGPGLFGLPPDPALAAPMISIGEYVSQVAARVRARPVPYSWVRP